MSIYDILQSLISNYFLRFLIIFAVPPLLLFLYFVPHAPLPVKAPPLTTENYPILGAIGFFTARWDFFRQASAHSRSGNFSFYLGKYPVVGLSGDVARQVFFESKQLGFAEGYSVLFGQAPSVQSDVLEEGGEGAFSQYFTNRITRIIRRETFVRGLPPLIADTRARLDELVKSPSGITDPFESIYKLVFQLTMRTVGCNDIANDRPLMEKALTLYETVEQSSTPTSIISPWLPTPALIKRTIAGTRLYWMFKKIVDSRNKTGTRDDDGLQYLIDQGDSMSKVIAFVIGALFAGQLNSGINAAWVLVYLGMSPEWSSKALAEITSVAKQHSTDPTAPLLTQLSTIPLDAWERDFEVLDLCLKDSIRLQLLGAAFRRNISGRDVAVGNEVIPNGAFVTYHLGDIHANPTIYRDPEEWDPSRYLPDRAEDKKKQYAYAGWGAARHPCLGMRFAKLESNIITAFFLATFEYSVCGADGEDLASLPPIDRNSWAAAKPSSPVFLKYRLREKQ